MASQLDKARRRKLSVLMRCGMNGEAAAIRAGYIGEHSQKPCLRPRPEMVEARAEIS